MSAILIFCDLRGRPVDERGFARAFRSIDDRGLDGRSYRVAGSIGMGFQAVALTRWQHADTQPFCSDDLCAVIDGRLDNRAELIRDLGMSCEAGAPPSDAELAARAYRKYGDDAAAHLLGDFALAVWDEDPRTLYCARDALGVRPLYYTERDGLLVISTDVKGVLGHPTLRREPNEAHVVEVMRDQFSNRVETLYLGVNRLPPAMWLSATDARVRTGRYWDVELTCDLQGTRTELRDEFLSVFRHAVASRLRAETEVTVALSGGLDSSLVAAVASTLARRSTPGSRAEVTTTSLLYPGMTCDESEWIWLITEHLGVEARSIVWTPMTWERVLEEARQTLYIPPYPNATVDMFARAGIRRAAVMSGSGGDQWLTGYSASFADAFHRRALFELTVEAARGALSVIVQEGMAAASARLARLRAVPLAAKPSELHPPWLGPKLRGAPLAERDDPPAVADASRARRQRHAMLHNPWQAYGYEMCDRATGRSGLVCTEPYYDRRVVEFLFAVPESARWRGADERVFARVALAGLAPPRLVGRTTKAEFSPASLRQMGVLDLPARIHSSRVAELGWVDPDAFVRSAWSGAAAPANRRAGWLVAAVESWARAAGG